MDVQKLAKVLALAASDNDAEALHALRTARRLLAGHGVDFVELARRVAEAEPSARAHQEALEDAVFDLRNEIRTLRTENARLKQARGPAPAPVAEAPSFHETAREMAAAIRLRAELERLVEELAAERREVVRLKAHETTLTAAIEYAQAESSQLAGRVSDAEARRMRLEVENRRLLHANHALTVELAEARKPVMLEVGKDNGAKPSKPAARAKAKAGASQYALF